VCVKVCTKKDMDLIIASCDWSGGAGVLTKDLIICDKFLDEGKTLMLMDNEGVDNLQQVGLKLYRDHPINDKGSHEPPVGLAFGQGDALKDTAQDIKTKIDADDAEKKAKEKAEEEARLEAEFWADTNDVNVPKGSYYVKSREWAAPETTEEIVDTRKGDDRYVSGGPPKQLNGLAAAAAAAANANASTVPVKPPRKITGYMATERDKQGRGKVYIDEPEVIKCDESQIQVKFEHNSYYVRVELEDGDVMTLGPVNCGLIGPNYCSWKLSKGKRLTITLAKDAPEEKKRAVYEGKKLEAMMNAHKDKENEDQDPNKISGSPKAVALTGGVALLVLVAAFAMKASGVV